MRQDREEGNRSSENWLELEQRNFIFDVWFWTWLKAVLVPSWFWTSKVHSNSQQVNQSSGNWLGCMVGWSPLLKPIVYFVFFFNRSISNLLSGLLSRFLDWQSMNRLKPQKVRRNCVEDNAISWSWLKNFNRLTFETWIQKEYKKPNGFHAQKCNQNFNNPTTLQKIG